MALEALKAFNGSLAHCVVVGESQGYYGRSSKSVPVLYQFCKEVEEVTCGYGNDKIAFEKDLEIAKAITLKMVERGCDVNNKQYAEANCPPCLHVLLKSVANKDEDDANCRWLYEFIDFFINLPQCDVQATFRQATVIDALLDEANFAIDMNYYFPPVFSLLKKLILAGATIHNYNWNEYFLLYYIDYKSIDVLKIMYYAGFKFPDNLLQDIVGQEEWFMAFEFDVLYPAYDGFLVWKQFCEWLRKQQPMSLKMLCRNPVRDLLKIQSKTSVGSKGHLDEILPPSLVKFCQFSDLDLLLKRE